MTDRSVAIDEIAPGAVLRFSFDDIERLGEIFGEAEPLTQRVQRDLEGLRASTILKLLPVALKGAEVSAVNDCGLPVKVIADRLLDAWCFAFFGKSFVDAHAAAEAEAEAELRRAMTSPILTLIYGRRIGNAELVAAAEREIMRGAGGHVQ